MRSRFGLDAARAVFVEARHAVGEQPHALQHVVDDERPEHVELEVARRAADSSRRRRCPCTCAATIVSASHCVGLTLPGMIELPGSFSGIVISPRPAARPARQPAHVVGDLHQRRGQRLERAVQIDQRIVRPPSPRTCWAR